MSFFLLTFPQHIIQSVTRNLKNSSLSFSLDRLFSQAMPSFVDSVALCDTTRHKRLSNSFGIFFNEISFILHFHQFSNFLFRFVFSNVTLLTCWTWLSLRVVFCFCFYNVPSIISKKTSIFFLILSPLLSLTHFLILSLLFSFSIYLFFLSFFSWYVNMLLFIL